MVYRFPNKSFPNAPRITDLRQSGLAPAAGQITSHINRLCQSTIQEITRIKGKYPIQDLVAMAKFDPTNRACRRLKTLRVQTALGKYTNSNIDIEQWVEGNFSSMEGDLQGAAAHLSNAMALGTAICEIVLDNQCPGRWGEWRLKALNPLDITQVTFQGMRGRIEYVVYREENGVRKYIPYHRVIHIVNDPEMAFNEPYGTAEAEAAMPYYKGKQLLTAEMLVSGKNQATGIMAAFADSNDSVRMLDANGQPRKNIDGTDLVVSSIESLAYQLSNLEQNSVVVTDLKNRIQPIALQTGESFYTTNLAYLNRQIMLAYGVSALMFDEGSTGGLGNSGISQTHQSVLDAQITGVVDQIRTKLLDKVIKPLLIYNFGAKYARQQGNFAVKLDTDPQTIINQGNFLLSTINAGAIPASDISAINVLREMAGVPKITAEDQQRLLYAQIAQQQMIQSAQQPQDPSQSGGQYQDPSQGQDPSADPSQQYP